MTASKTATVETLTAEVRVLMVGTRQVTLSVYGQLDFVEIDAMEPFGRVRPRDAQLDYIYLIGRHLESGSLVRAAEPGGEESIKRELVWSEYERAIRNATDQAREHKRRADEFTKHGVRAEDARIEWAEGEKALAEAHRIRREYEMNAAPLREQAAELGNLPLIVLAGLR
jgi:hypothetical protein